MTELKVTSVAGSTSGSTAVTVEPELSSGNSYRYKVAANPTLPAAGQKCNIGYTAWNGEDEIAASTGQKIVMAEVDVNNRCTGTGLAVVASKE